MASRLIETTRTMRLAAFLSKAGRQSWSWGLNDCVMTAADWVFAETGHDPAGPYRGAYTTADECHALIKKLGGFMPLIGYRMDECGFERTQSPRTGDVGIINAPVGMQASMPVVGTIGAIFQDGLWVMRSARGLRFETPPVVTLVTAWRV